MLVYVFTIHMSKSKLCTCIDTVLSHEDSEFCEVKERSIKREVETTGLRLWKDWEKWCQIKTTKILKYIYLNMSCMKTHTQTEESEL